MKTILQLLFMPILAPALGEERLFFLELLIRLIVVLLQIKWQVPYAAAMFSLFYVFSQPCVSFLLIVYKIFHILAAYQCLFYNMQIRSIVSKQVGPCEQGKAQGIISGIGSFANVASPLAFSPLTG
ncbi:hypothetical protein Gohar_023755 [Gossypium harknessii]|uniref:Uncharacterized protein n=1 Tax=Gossypium harknessii TaxID=34285 RepID=A0A7J9HDS4_9ROSI|nr:hypothetical protein [Gossypium harknessii]